jgi:hypothetical protein
MNQTTENIKKIESHFMPFTRNTVLPYSEYLRLCNFFCQMDFVSESHEAGILLLAKFQEFRDYLDS